MKTNKSKIKLGSVLCVAVLVATAFSTVATNVSAKKNDEEKIVESLNPDAAMDRYTHIVWQENLTGNFEIYYANNASGNYENTLKKAISKTESLMGEEDNGYENVLEELEEALEDCLEQDYKHSINSVHEAVKDLGKLGAQELIITLINSVRDFAKTNILYGEDNLTFSNKHIQEAYQKYYLAVKKYEENNYDATIEQFKNSYLKLKEAYEELEENDDDVNFVGIDFGKITRISYTNYDSVAPRIFLNGTINVGWKEIMNNMSHVYYARSTNNGITWWYFDVTKQASTYLSYLGIDPYTVSVENTINIVIAMERIWILDKCHFFYAPIA